MARRLKARVNRDGTVSDDPIWYYPIDPETGKPFEGDGDRPGVGIRLRHIPPAEYRQLVQTHTTRVVDPDTKALIERVDNAALADAACTLAIQEWYGIEAADGGPLPCLDGIKSAVLDIVSRAEVQYLATRALLPFVTEDERRASFRKPAGVADVVGRVEQEQPVLSTRERGGTGDGDVRLRDVSAPVAAVGAVDD